MISKHRTITLSASECLDDDIKVSLIIVKLPNFSVNLTLPFNTHNNDFNIHTVCYYKKLTSTISFFES